MQQAQCRPSVGQSIAQADRRATLDAATPRNSQLRGSSAQQLAHACSPSCDTWLAATPSDASGAPPRPADTNTQASTAAAHSAGLATCRQGPAGRRASASLLHAGIAAAAARADTPGGRRPNAGALRLGGRQIDACCSLQA